MWILYVETFGYSSYCLRGRIEINPKGFAFPMPMLFDVLKFYIMVESKGSAIAPKGMEGKVFGFKCSVSITSP